MSDNGWKPWLWGCGIGCGLVLLIVVGLFTASFFFARNMVRGFEDAERSRAELATRFGDAGDFTPWPDGAVPAERMEAFLRVREATTEARAKLGDKFKTIQQLASNADAGDLDSRSVREKLGFMINIGSSAFGLGAELGDFFAARNNALLEAGMGPGEYGYVYVLSYYSLLGRSPRDGMDGFQADVHEGAPGGGVRWEVEIGDERRAGWPNPETRRQVLAVFENQLAALDETSPEAWRLRLRDEVRALKSDPSRVPWQDGLPGSIAASLEPYRARLETTYDSRANFFELMPGRSQQVRLDSD